MTPTQRAEAKAALDAWATDLERGMQAFIPASSLRKISAALAEPAPVQEPAKKGLFVDLIAQQPAPPADVPMLTEDEIVVALHVALPSLSYDSEDAFISGVRAGEQAVRQKAGLP